MSALDPSLQKNLQHLSESEDEKKGLDTAEATGQTTPIERDDEAQDDPFEQYRMDGGKHAWLAVLGGWILIFNSWGLSNVYGVFQTYYTTELLAGTSPTAISWIGSIQSFLTGFTAVFGGWLIDSGRHREILIAATFLEVFGMMMTSLGSRYWHLLLSQGICVGLGSGLLAVTSPAVLASYFRKKRLLAGGIASTGGGVAGVILPIMMQNLLTRIGFGWSVRVLGFLMLALLLLALWAIRPRVIEKRFVPLQPRWLREPTYVSFILGMPSPCPYPCAHPANGPSKAFAFINAALYVPSFYIQDYALALGFRTDLAFYMLAILNGASAVCRIAPNWIADYLGAINILIPTTLSTAIVAFCWRESHNLGGLIAVSVGWALASGALISLPPVGIANLTHNPAEYGTRIGLGYTVSAFGALVGNPIAGAARGARGDGSRQAVQREFQGTWFVAGGAASLAVVLLLFVRWRLVGWKLWVKV